jgi:hypothetical protein
VQAKVNLARLSVIIDLVENPTDRFSQRTETQMFFDARGSPNNDE